MVASPDPSCLFHLPLEQPGPSSVTADRHAHNAIDDSTMGREKEKPHLDIVLDSPQLFLKGTGPDVEPARLSGHVSLFLTEATALKEITLHFRGKARIPMPASESLMNNGTFITYVVCTHDWSFLEGDRKHSRTLKAGRHFFPFSIEVGGTLPSSIYTPVFGGASVSYKLRAVATRPGFAHNLQHTTPVHILRSFTPEALEYQQSLEIENTWPEKLMYAILLPHKAWAAGDTLVAVFKFSPLAKGVSVSSIVSTLYETTKVYARSGTQEETRVVASVRHEAPGKRSREGGEGASGGSPSGASVGARETGPPAQPSSAEAGSSRSSSRPSSPIANEDDTDDDFEDGDVVTYVTLPIPPTSRDSASPAPTPPATSPAYPCTPQTQAPSPAYLGTPSASQASSSVITMTSTTPTHALQPINVTHRLRWAIFIRNRDGHTSELRASLPVHILDERVLDDARACSLRTRQIVLGAVGLGTGTGTDGQEGDGQEVQRGVDRDSDRELPSYPAHVRDRVANMFLPEGAMVRAPSPWVGRIAEAGPSSSAESVDDVTCPFGTSGRNTPAGLPSGMAQLPHAPASDQMTPLEWVNTELLLSLSDAPLRTAQTHIPLASPTARQNRGSRVGSRWGSREHSRVHSRSGSPERRGSLESSAQELPLASTPEQAQNSDGASSTTSISHTGGSTHSGHHSHSSVLNLFKATIKPFAALAHGHKHHPAEISEHETSPPSHSLFSLLSLSRGSDHEHPRSPGHQLPHSPSTLSHSTTADNNDADDGHGPSEHPSRAPSPPLTGEALMHRAFTEVPDYSIAARGFIGGVPPLSSMRGLPSYEEAARTPHRRRSSALDDVDVQPGSSVVRGTNRSRSRERRHVASKSDLPRHFAHAAEVYVEARHEEGIMQRLDGVDGAGDEGSEEGIQMHART